MNHIKLLVDSMVQRFRSLAQGNAVVARPISIGDRHVVPLCELGLGFGGGGGSGEAGEGVNAGSGTGAGAAGGVKTSPVAVLVIEGNKVRLEKIGN